MVGFEVDSQPLAFIRERDCEKPGRIATRLFRPPQWQPLHGKVQPTAFV